MLSLPDEIKLMPKNCQLKSGFIHFIPPFFCQKLCRQQLLERPDKEAVPGDQITLKVEKGQLTHFH